MEKGNTVGILVNQPAPSGSPSAANPAVEPETEEEKSWWESIWDGAKWVYNNPMEATHYTLDGVGLIPGIGELADGVNALLYVAEGDYTNAALSGASMIPVIGNSATVAKWGNKAVKGVKKSTEKVVEKVTKETTETAIEKSVQKEVKTATAEQTTKKANDATKSKHTDNAGNNNGGGGKVKKQKPHKDCGKVSKYNKAPKKKGVLNADHVPSGKALKNYATIKLRDMGALDALSDAELKRVLNSLYNNAPTITIPEDVHKEGRTYGNKNKGLHKEDGKSLSSLKEAFKKDTKAIQKSMDTKEHGCSEAYKKAVEQLTEFDWEQYITDILSKNKYVKEVLK